MAFLVLGTLLGPALAIAAESSQSDPLLTETRGPCDPRLAGPDYVAGTDVNGNPVTSADEAQSKVPMPEGMLLPLGGQPNGNGRFAQPRAYAALSQKQMDSILNPKPACPPARGAR